MENQQNMLLLIIWIEPTKNSNLLLIQIVLYKLKKFDQTFPEVFLNFEKMEIINIE